MSEYTTNTQATCDICGKQYGLFGIGSHLSSHKRRAVKLKNRIRNLMELESRDDRWFSDSEHNELQRLRKELKEHIVKP